MQSRDAVQCSALVYPSVHVGAPDGNGFRTGRVGFRVIELSSRSTLVRGAFSGTMNEDLAQADAAVAPLFLVLGSGMEQRASLCQR